MSNFQFHDLLTKLDIIAENDTEQKDGDYVKGTDEITSKQTPGEPSQAHALDGKLVGESEEDEDDDVVEEDDTESEDDNAENDPWGIGESGVYGGDEEKEDDADNNDSPVSNLNGTKDESDEDESDEDESDEDESDEDESDEESENEIDIDEDMIMKLTDEFADFLQQKVEGGELDIHDEFDPELEENGEEHDTAAALDRVKQRAQARGGPTDRIKERVAARLEPGEEQLEEEPEEEPEELQENPWVSESAPKAGETIKLNGEKAIVIAVNESRMIVKTAHGKRKIVEMSNIKVKKNK